MLVVTCRPNEGIAILDAEDNVVEIIKVVSVRGNSVRIGTDAHASVRILRTRAYERIYGHEPVVAERVVDPTEYERTPHPAVGMMPMLDLD